MVRIRWHAGMWLLAGALGAGVALAGTKTVLHNFIPPPKGANPESGVIGDSAGNLYGTAYGGGAYNAGVVYEIDPAGVETVLYNFTGGDDGGEPQGGVIRDSSGNLYGTTFRGGPWNAGVVYMLSPAGQETVLYAFTGGADGAVPEGPLVRDPAGNFYGTTVVGGTGNAGVVFMLDTAGHETVLHRFTGGADGRAPYPGVVRDSAGNLYGTTNSGGFDGRGVVYKLDASGKETVLHTFTTREGKNPQGVIRDPAGNLFGVTQGGGLGRAGTVFRLDTSGKLTALYQFTGGADGGTPVSGVIRDSQGNIYGTTLLGGTANLGVVYMVATGGSETVLHTFTGSDGAFPYSGVLRDPAGNLYGTARSGGAGYSGLVYKIDAAGRETVVHAFTDRADGWSPYAGLTADAEGNLYGTTYQGGPGAGTLFKLDSAGHETLLHTFTGGTDGEQPSANVIRDSAGNFYGTTQFGGTANAGVVFKVDATGEETVLYSFSGGADGAQPVAGLVRDAAGNLFGTTENGGNANLGVVFEVSATGQETVLHSFAGGTDGARPLSGLAADPRGFFYGTTFEGGAEDNGVAYIVDSAGGMGLIHTFTGKGDGGDPESAVTIDSAGNVYGTTAFGGLGSTGGYGVVYKIDPMGNESVLYQFTGGADGGYPMSNLIRDSAGNLYGTAQGGGSGNFGVVFMLSPAGQETVLYNFLGGPDGENPTTGLIRDAAGNLFGTVAYGGTKGGGTIYKITVP